MMGSDDAVSPAREGPAVAALRIVGRADATPGALSPSPAQDKVKKARLLAEIAASVPVLRTRARQLIWREDVEDLVQDTIERAVRALDAFEPGTNLRGWLYVIMIHRARDLLRREGLRRSRSSEGEVERLEAPTPEPPVQVAFTLEEIVEALGQVKEPLREALVLRVLGHKSYAEIARMQDIPIATAGTRIKRARSAVQGILERLRRDRGDVE